MMKEQGKSGHEATAIKLMVADFSNIKREVEKARLTFDLEGHLMVF